ncbi:MAG: hypothetical protein NVSMB65_19330 [Chloroflexota bacterium]
MAASTRPRVSLTPGITGYPAHRGRTTRTRRWPLVLASLLLALMAALAIPAVRGFLVDLVLYQGDGFLSAPRARFVTRTVHLARGTITVRVPVRHGTVLSYALTSPILRHDPRRTLYVYLPPGYTDPANHTRRYPVAYLLHGSPGGPQDWWRGGHADAIADELIAAGRIKAMILVLPDGNGNKWRDSQFINAFNGRDRVMDYLAWGVVPWVDRHFRTIPTATGRALGGLSMGGYGAYNVGLHHPTVWRTLFSIGGYFTADRGEVFGANDPYGRNRGFLLANSLTYYVGRVPGVRHMHLLIEESTADWGGYTQKALAFSHDQRQWIVTAYALAFGSLLLLGGRIGDLYGRKRTLMVGLLGFALLAALLLARA